MALASTAMTLTFGECAENHVGNQQLGEIGEAGFTLDEMAHARESFESAGCRAELVELGQGAAVLVVCNGVKAFGVGADALFAEHDALDPDKKALMYKKVVNKKARHNLCYDEASQCADYQAGKGTVVAFAAVPLLQKIRDGISRVMGTGKAAGLKCELNKYYDPSKCGIGFHGDSERKMVVAVRLGVSIPLHFQWFHRHEPIGERFVISLQHGDMYVMSEKATGFDWKSSSIPTLRHAAGCASFTTIKRQLSQPVVRRYGIPDGEAKRKLTSAAACASASAKRAKEEEPEPIKAAALALQNTSLPVEKLLVTLRYLEAFAMDLSALRSSGVALAVKPLRSHQSDEVAGLASDLYSRWKRWRESR